MGLPATMSHARSALSTRALFILPMTSRKRRPSGVSGTKPDPTSFVTTTVSPARAARAAKTAEAVSLLQRAADQRPEDAAIREHLGFAKE